MGRLEHGSKLIRPTIGAVCGDPSTFAAHPISFLGLGALRDGPLEIPLVNRTREIGARCDRCTDNPPVLEWPFLAVEISIPSEPDTLWVCAICHRSLYPSSPALLFTKKKSPDRWGRGFWLWRPGAKRRRGRGDLRRNTVRAHQLREDRERYKHRRHHRLNREARDESRKRHPSVEQRQCEPLPLEPQQAPHLRVEQKRR